MIQLQSKTGLQLTDQTYVYLASATKKAQKLVDEGLRKNIYLFDTNKQSVVKKVS